MNIRARRRARRQLLSAARIDVYFPQAYKLNEHGKYLLMAPSKDRAGTLGFRCAMDE